MCQMILASLNLFTRARRRGSWQPVVKKKRNVPIYKEDARIILASSDVAVNNRINASSDSAHRLPSRDTRVRIEGNRPGFFEGD